MGATGVKLANRIAASAFVAPIASLSLGAMPCAPNSSAMLYTEAKMPRGPLPDPHAQRRNKPTIPTTELPLEGFQGDIPPVPDWIKLGPAGQEYWAWAWRTQEAAAWGTGAVDSVARRASLEDDLAAMELATDPRLRELLEDAWDTDQEVERFMDLVEGAMRALGKAAGGRLAIIREIGKLDEVLGLTPKAKAQLRWTVKGQSSAAPSPANPAAQPPPEGKRSRDRLKVVNGGAG